MDKAKIQFLKDIRQKISASRQLTGDELEMFSYFYGSGTGTQLAVAASKTSVDLVFAVMQRITLPVEYHLSSVPEFRECPDTGNTQVQKWNTVEICDGDKSYPETSPDDSMSKLLVLVFLDMLIGREERVDD